MSTPRGTHLVVDHEQDARLGAVVVGVDQNGTLFQLGAVDREDQVGGGIRQRLDRMEQVGYGLASVPKVTPDPADSVSMHPETSSASCASWS